MSIEDIDQNINTYYRQNPEEARMLAEGNPLAVYKRQCLSSINNRPGRCAGNPPGLTAGGERIDPRIFEDPINSEIYQGIVESAIGNIPIFSELF